MGFIEGNLRLGPVNRLGQVPTSIAQGVPAEVPLVERLQEQYGDLRASCVERFGADFCRTVMPDSVFRAMEQREPQLLPWWMWLGLGILIAKIVRL